MPRLAPAPTKTKSRGTPAPATVVVADSDEAALDTMRRFLLLRGYEVETATGGVECLRKLRWCANPVLVVDLDLRWGGGDGVLAVLNEEPALAGVPVILTSAHPVADGASGLATHPAPRVLVKPFSLESLLDLIHRATAAQEAAPRGRGGERSGPRTRPEPGYPS